MKRVIMLVPMIFMISAPVAAAASTLPVNTVRAANLSLPGALPTTSEASSAVQPFAQESSTIVTPLSVLPDTPAAAPTDQSGVDKSSSYHSRTPLSQASSYTYPTQKLSAETTTQLNRWSAGLLGLGLTLTFGIFEMAQAVNISRILNIFRDRKVV